MSYLIVVLGVLLLLVNVISWRKLKSFSRQSEQKVYLNFSLITYVNGGFNEWKKYTLGDNSWKGCRWFIIGMGILVSLSVVNYHCLRFDNLLFIPASIIIIYYVQLRVGRMLHRNHFEDSFPEVLSVVNAAVAAGNSIHQALHRCGEGIEGDLGESFNRLDRRLNLGEDPERVFYDVWKIYPYREFNFFVIVMLVSIQRGGQLRELISRLSRIVNTSKNMARRKKAMTSEARASSKIVAAIPLLFFIGMKYFSPENFDFIVNDPIGRYILYYVIGSEILGMLIIWILLKRAV